MARPQVQLERLGRTVHQVIMSCRDELKKAEDTLKAGRPDIAADHLRSIAQDIQARLTGEDPESATGPEPAKSQ